MAYKLTQTLAEMDKACLVSYTTPSVTLTRDNYYMLSITTSGTSILSVTSTAGINFTKLTDVDLGRTSVWGGNCSPGAPTGTGTISISCVAGTLNYVLEEINGARMMPINMWTAASNSAPVTIPAPNTNNVLWMVGTNAANMGSLMPGWNMLGTLPSTTRRLMTGATVGGATATAGFTGTASTANVIAVEFQPDFSYGSTP